MSDRDDELSRHIGTLWRTAMAGLDTTREVVLRSMQTGRLRVDIALLQKERSQLLETLGESVIALLDDGSWEDAPGAVRQIALRIKDVEGRLKSDTFRRHDNSFGAPRGYEPEAATDYGDDHEEPSNPEDQVDEHAEVANNSARARPRKKAAAKKKGSHR